MFSSHVLNQIHQKTKNKKQKMSKNVFPPKIAFQTTMKLRKEDEIKK